VEVGKKLRQKLNKYGKNKNSNSHRFFSSSRVCLFNGKKNFR
jgi:hypothetical protein